MICEKCDGTGLENPTLVCKECIGTGKIMEEETVVAPAEEEVVAPAEESFLEESGEELAPAPVIEEVLPE